MAKIKCSSCKKQKWENEFSENEIIKGDEGYENKWGYCQNCVSLRYSSLSPCSCCGSRNHSNDENVDPNCEDWNHKIADGLRESWIGGNEQKNDEGTITSLADLGFLRKCEHFNKYLAPILGDNCECCGWYCVKEGEDECNYRYCGGAENSGNGKCRIRKTCEDYWKDKEEERKRDNISKEIFYAKNVNKPKYGFSCSHFERETQSEGAVINELRTENDELQARIRELETQLANTNLQAQQEQQPK